MEDKFTDKLSIQRETKVTGEEIKTIPVWCEGYRATGEHGTAHVIYPDYKNLFFIKDVKTFEETVLKLMELYPKLGIVDRGEQKEIKPTNPLYEVRPRARFAIWGCGLYDNEIDARKNFG